MFPGTWAEKTPDKAALVIAETGETTTYAELDERSLRPVYHAAPMRYTGVIQALGGTVVLMQRFDTENFLRAVQEHRVTDTQCVPTMFVRMLKLPEEVRASYDTSSLRTVVHAAAPRPVEVKQQMMDWLAHPGTVGKPLLGTPRICGPDGTEVAAGEVGTIYFERDEEPFTYHGDVERTASTRHPEHPLWSTVGDLGYLDEEGYLFLTDRKAFKVPREFVVTDDLPRTPTGKLVKQKLRDRYDAAVTA